MEDRKFIVTDAEGNEKEMYILFTTTLEEFNKSYIFYKDLDENQGQVYVSTFDQEGNLGAVESEEEWVKLEEVFNDYKESLKSSCCGCHGNCDDGCENDCNCDGDCQCDCEHDEENECDCKCNCNENN